MKILIDFGIGILLFIGHTLLQVPIISIFRGPFSGSSGPIPSLTAEYLVGSVVIFIISFGFAWIFKTKDKAQAGGRAIIWTLTSALFTLVLGVIDAVDAGTFRWSSLGEVVSNSLGNLAFYAILLGIFMGPILFAWIKRQNELGGSPYVFSQPRRAVSLVVDKD